MLAIIKNKMGTFGPVFASFLIVGTIVFAGLFAFAVWGAVSVVPDTYTVTGTVTSDSRDIHKSPAAPVDVTINGSRTTAWVGGVYTTGEKATVVVNAETGEPYNGIVSRSGAALFGSVIGLLFGSVLAFFAGFAAAGIAALVVFVRKSRAKTPTTERFNAFV